MPASWLNKPMVMARKMGKRYLREKRGSDWIMNAIVSWIFPVLFARSHGIPFVFFALMMVVQFFVVLFFYPETKGYTLEEMQHRLGIE